MNNLKAIQKYVLIPKQKLAQNKILDAVHKVLQYESIVVQLYLTL